MPAGIARASALSMALILTLIAARATLAQGVKPDSPSATITLPAAGSTNTAGTVWAATNTGAGRAGYFAVTSSANITAALEARSYSTSTGAIAISAVMSATKSASNSAANSATNWRRRCRTTSSPSRAASPACKFRGW